MTIVVANYRYVPEEGRLAPLRGERLAYFDELGRQGVLLASGQLLGSETSDGMLALEAADLREAGRILDADPFVTAGLVVERELCEWRATTGVWLRS